MSALPPEQAVEVLYKEFHGHSNAVNNILQFYYNHIQEQKVQIQMLQKALDETNRKLKEHDPVGGLNPKITTPPQKEDHPKKK